MLCVTIVRRIAAAFALFACTPLAAADRGAWASTLPVYDHIVVVVEENKDVEQIFGSQFDASYIRGLATEGAVIDASLSILPRPQKSHVIAEVQNHFRDLSCDSGQVFG